MLFRFSSTVTDLSVQRTVTGRLRPWHPGRNSIADAAWPGRSPGFLDVPAQHRNTFLGWACGGPRSNPQPQWRARRTFTEDDMMKNCWHAGALMVPTTGLRVRFVRASGLDKAEQALDCGRWSSSKGDADGRSIYSINSGRAGEVGRRRRGAYLAGQSEGTSSYSRVRWWCSLAHNT